jgi:hypothetical protein
MASSWARVTFWPAPTRAEPASAQCMAASLAASRSSSAHTSAMRPEISMRPAAVGAALLSMTRNTRTGRRGGAMAGERETSRIAGFAAGRARDRIGACAIPRREQVSAFMGDASQPISACKGEKKPDTVNNAIPMGHLSTECWTWRCWGQTPRHGLHHAYMSMVLRIKPTAKPSISNGSPGSTMMVW